jgi:hypothetical protein
MTGTCGGNLADEVLRESIVTLKVGSASKAVVIGVPTEPVAPAMRTLWIAEDIVMIELGAQCDGYEVKEAFSTRKSRSSSL